MSGNASNASNVHKRARTASRLTTAFEVFVLAEILYYSLTDGKQTLHGAIGGWCERTFDAVAYAAEVARTRLEIHKLPEQER